jgi:hypothetical protein
MQSGGSFWRKELPEISDDYQVTKGGLLAHQRAVWELPNFIKMLVMGYGGGKSFTIGKRAISVALQNAPSPYAIICPSYPMAKLTTIPTLRALLEGKRQLLGRAFWWKFVGQAPYHFRIRYRGRDATIWVLSSDSPESLKGSNLGAAALEEPFMQPKAAFAQALARVRDPSAKISEIFLAGTPEALNWGYDLAEGEDREKYDVGLVRGSTMDNTAVNPEYAERLLSGFDKKAADAYVRGNFVNLSKGLVYYGFERSEHVVSAAMPSGAELGCGMDFNVNPMSFVVFWTKGDRIHFMKEYELPNADTAYACDLLRDDWGYKLQEMYPDASGGARSTKVDIGRSDFTIIREKGFHVNSRSSNPSRRDRYNAVNGKFRPVKGRHTVTVSPECVKLVSYLSQYTHESMNKKDHVAMSHLLDAATYPIAYLWPVARASITTHKLHGA